MFETAYAKINLALHVRRRREDGYHELETVFAFVDQGDLLTASPAAYDVLNVTGEFAGALDNATGNVVMQALNSLKHVPGWAVNLEKRLPVAAGLGGGSADAGAIFRMVQRWSGLPDNWREIAARLGADVPACVESITCIGRGTGTELLSVVNDLAGKPVLLVNPRIPLSTGPVFRGWSGIDEGPLPEGSAWEIALYGRNDLELSAMELVSEVADVLELLRASNAAVSRMSGSGATCFALYHDEQALAAAQMEIQRKRPHWWTMAGKLR